MIPQTEFIEMLCEIVEQDCALIYPISLKELATDGGIYAEIGEGFNETQYFDKRTIVTIPVLFLCRNLNQKLCLEQLMKICNYLQGKKKYPSGQSFGWLKAEVAKHPGKIGRDEDGVYHASCIVNCDIYF